MVDIQYPLNNIIQEGDLLFGDPIALRCPPEHILIKTVIEKRLLSPGLVGVHLPVRRHGRSVSVLVGETDIGNQMTGPVQGLGGRR